MGRFFAAGGTNGVDLGDITAARFLSTSAWSTLFFFRWTDVGMNEHVLFSKWSQSSAGRQFKLVIPQSVDGDPLSVQHNSGGLVLDGANTSAGIWYLVSVSCNGSASITFYRLTMDGSIVDNGLNGSTTGDRSTLTTPVHIGNADQLARECNCNIAYVVYVEKTVSLDEIKSYLVDPVRTVLRWKSEGVNAPFFLPLGLGSPDHDWSGTGNTGTVTGTTVGDNPPIVPYRFSSHVPAEGETGGTVSVPTANAASSAVTPAVMAGATTVSVPVVSGAASAVIPVVTATATLAVPAISAAGALVEPTVNAGASTVSVPTVLGVSAAVEPAVSAGASTVSVPTATASSGAIAPNVVAGGAPQNITVPVAAATAASVVPSATSGATSVAVPAASATGTAPEPAITAGGAPQNISVPVASASAIAFAPAVDIRPPYSVDLVLRLDAETGVTVTGGDIVTNWDDQSGQANHLTAAGDPRLVTAGLQGLNYIAFDGVGDMISRPIPISGLPAANANRSVFMVANYHSVGLGGFTYGDNATGQAFGAIVGADGNLIVQVWGPSDANSGVAGTGAGWLIQEIVLNSGTMKHYKDGTQIDTRTGWTLSTDVAAGEGIVIGAEIDGSPNVEMDVAEILVYDRALSDAERQEVEGYLQGKYFVATQIITVPTAVAASSAVAPSVEGDAQITVPVASATGSVITPSVTGAVTVTSPNALAAATAVAPAVIAAGAPQNITVPVALAAGTAVEPSVNSGAVTLSAPTVLATSAAIAPALVEGGAPQTIAVPVASAAATAVTPGLVPAATTLAVPVAMAIASAHAPATPTGLGVLLGSMGSRTVLGGQVGSRARLLGRVGQRSLLQGEVGAG